MVLPTEMVFKHQQLIWSNKQKLYHSMDKNELKAATSNFFPWQLIIHMQIFIQNLAQRQKILATCYLLHKLGKFFQVPNGTHFLNYDTKRKLDGK